MDSIFFVNNFKLFTNACISGAIAFIQCPPHKSFGNYKTIISIKVKNKDVPTGALSSYSKAREIALELKSWIKKGKFQLTERVAALPSAESGYNFKPLKERPVE